MYQDDDDFDENLKRLMKTLSEYVDEKTFRVRVLIEMLTHLLLGTTKISELEVLALVVSIYQDRMLKLKASWYFPTRAFAIQSRWVSIVIATEDLAETLCLVSNSPMRMKTLPQYFDFSYVIECWREYDALSVQLFARTQVLCGSEFYLARDLCELYEL